MKKRLFAGGAIAAVIIAGVVVFTRPSVARASALQRAAAGQLPQQFITTPNGKRPLPRFSSALVNSAAASSGPAAAPNSQAAPNVQAAPNAAQPGTLGCSTRNTAPSSLHNVRVNQDCTYRVQAEEGIAFNPASPNNIIAGMNDERQGFNLGAFAYSFDNGATWGDGPPPFYQKINDPSQEKATKSDPNNHTITGLPGNGFTYDGGSDPMLAFDSEGRAFYGLVVFDRDLGNGGGVMVTQSPVGADGTFYYTADTFSRNFVVVEDNDPTIVHDKPFIRADTFPNSPNHDNVYVTWTVFRVDASTGATLQSPIYGSMSTDHGLTWSTPEKISGKSSSLCFFGNFFDKSLDPHSCDFDQGSDPMVLPNGDLEVVFNNGNTPANDPNGQQLAVHCSPSGSSPKGTARLDCGTPVKVGDDVLQGEPQCNFGRGPEMCIPGSFVRNDDFPRIAENHGNGDLYATWNDFRNGEYDVQLSSSTDGGKTWTTAASPVNHDTGVDHYQASVDVVCSGSGTQGNPACPANGAGSNTLSTNGSNLCGPGTTTETATTTPGGDHVAVSYYRTCQIPNETAACPLGSTTLVCTPGTTPGVQSEPSDYDLMGGFNSATPFTGLPVSPVFPPPQGGRETGFMGDYSGIVVLGTTAHPIWADPRNAVPVQFQEPQADQRAINDNDIFTVATGVPG
ncbi:MAG TPA: sialidase family protein [Candidatus Dormibacteraeota bacterium]